MMHRLKGIGLPNVVLVDGFRVEGRGAAAVHFYDDLDGLYEAIARAVCLASSELSAAELRFLRKRLDLSQEELGALVDKKGQTVAKWEKGELPVPRAEAVFFRMRWLARNSSAQDLVRFARRLASSNERSDPAELVFSKASGHWLQQEVDVLAASKRARRHPAAAVAAGRPGQRAKATHP